MLWNKRMYRIKWASLCFVLAALPTVASAQFPSPPKINFEDARRGMESVVRAASQSNSSGPSSPLVDGQTAKSMSYDNQIKATNTYFEKRKLNRQYRREERGPRPTQQQFNTMSKMDAPARLNSSQVDSYTGRLNWPVVLRTDAHKTRRELLEATYAQHTVEGGGINTTQYATVQRLAKGMQEQLRSEIKEITPEQYSYARKFLEGIRVEARQPSGA